jgi:hypothetical protein
VLAVELKWRIKMRCFNSDDKACDKLLVSTHGARARSPMAKNGLSRWHPFFFALSVAGSPPPNPLISDTINQVRGKSASYLEMEEVFFL